MSTRCNIIVRDEWQTLQLYRHMDGYPEGECGVVAGIGEAFKYAWKWPRFEASDFIAALVRAWKVEGGGGIYFDGEYKENPDGTNSLHGDIAFLYEIDIHYGMFRVRVSHGYGGKSISVEGLPDQWDKVVAEIDSWVANSTI